MVIFGDALNVVQFITTLIPYGNGWRNVFENVQDLRTQSYHLHVQN